MKTMRRLDATCIEIAAKLSNPEVSAEDRKKYEKELKERETLLMPLYHQVAVMFADLHDTPGRMQEKNVISVSQSMKLAHSCSFFFQKELLYEKKTVTRCDEFCKSLIN